MLTGSPAPWKLQDFRVFRSPAYVLDKRLQDGNSLRKWKACCWLGVYVGVSLVHAGNVPVIYNPTRTHISPQFHVVHDNKFTWALRLLSTISGSYYETLYNKAKWIYEPSADYEAEEIHMFDTYWSDPPLSKPKTQKQDKPQQKNARNCFRKCLPRI
jgi:hypothetical protein